MYLSKKILLLSHLLTALLALAAYLGGFVQGTYALEAKNWAEQGSAQDLVTLFLVVPLLVFSAYRAYKNSLGFFLLYLGVLLYNIYSYILYAMFIHFGTWFLLYILILGLSFYLLLFSLLGLDYHKLREQLRDIETKGISLLLILISLFFTLMWLQEILTSLSSGIMPKSLAETGLIVNPIHILDLALLLPGAFLVGWNLRSGKTLAKVLALPLVVFFVLMGVAIIAMAINTAGDISSIIPVLVSMSLVVMVNIVMGIKYFKKISNKSIIIK